MAQRRLLDLQRVRFLRSWERRRGSRVIALIHRQETMSLLGFPLIRYIDIQDSEELLRALRLTAEDVPIDIVLHTPGGLALAAEQIAHAIARRKGQGDRLHTAACDRTTLSAVHPGAVSESHARAAPAPEGAGAVVRRRRLSSASSASGPFASAAPG